MLPVSIRCGGRIARNGQFGDRSGQHTGDLDVLAVPVVVLAVPVGVVATLVGANPEVANRIV